MPSAIHCDLSGPETVNETMVAYTVKVHLLGVLTSFHLCKVYTVILSM